MNMQQCSNVIFSAVCSKTCNTRQNPADVIRAGIKEIDTRRELGTALSVLLCRVGVLIILFLKKMFDQKRAAAMIKMMKQQINLFCTIHHLAEFYNSERSKINTEQHTKYIKYNSINHLLTRSD